MQIYTQFGLRIGNSYIPDPSSFVYTISDLDISAERDTNGKLHRGRVATKHNCKIKYDALTYSIVMEILQLLTAAEFSFSFIRPDTLQEYTGTYYVGDRTMNVINALDDRSKWLCDLSFDLIEY